MQCSHPPRENSPTRTQARPSIIYRGIGQSEIKYWKLTVADDVMFVNGIPFVVSVLRGFNFTMVKYVSQRLNTVVANSTGKIFQFY